MARGRMVMLAAGVRAGERRAEQAQQQQQAAAPQAAAPAAPASTDTTAELKKLADLHAQGVLTDEEFAASKKKLLGI
jgi:membrane protease subunit (stomatin/prohibitin family)